MAPRVYKGTFGPAQAERLLWRAGFGPRRGEAKALAAKGLDAGVLTLTRPGPEQLVGPEPKADKGLPIAPADAFGHDHIWWLDRMVRSSNSLVERMTLVWHDWFATQRVGGAAQRLMLDQNELFRRHALGSFSALLVDVTKDPAMLLWLNGNRNTKRSPNENYARELMELFTLGADRGYTEADVREQARALTGWRNTYVRGTGPHTSATTRPATTAGRRACSARPAPSGGKTPAGSASRTRSTRPSSSTSSGATSCPSRPTG